MRAKIVNRNSKAKRSRRNYRRIKTRYKKSKPSTRVQLTWRLSRNKANNNNKFKEKRFNRALRKDLSVIILFREKKGALIIESKINSEILEEIINAIYDLKVEIGLLFPIGEGEDLNAVSPFLVPE